MTPRGIDARRSERRQQEKGNRRGIILLTAPDMTGAYRLTNIRVWV